MECEDDVINPDFNTCDNEETNYDEVRPPHKQLVNSGGIKMPVLVKKLGPSLTCPICLDLLRNTTVTECLHRFCADCIKNSIYKTNRQCPTCRRKIVSKRNLRSDPNIDLLIDTIWPDRNIYEKIHNILMESTCESPTKIRDLTVENDDNFDDFSSSENDFPSNDEKEEYDFSSSDNDELNDFDKSSSFNSSSDFENENIFIKNKRQKFEEKEENIPKNQNIKENIKLLPEMDIYLKEYVKNTLPLGNVTIYLKPLLINSQQYYRVHLPHLATVGDLHTKLINSDILPPSKENFNVNNIKCSLCLYVESPNGQMIKLFNLDSICMVLGFSKRKNFNDNPIIYYSF